MTRRTFLPAAEIRAGHKIPRTGGGDPRIVDTTTVLCNEPAVTITFTHGDYPITVPLANRVRVLNATQLEGAF